MDNNFERDLVFSSMIKDLDEKDDKKALTDLGYYLYNEYRYTFTELKKEYIGDFDGFIADVLMKGQYFKEPIDSFMSDLNSRRKRHASLIAEELLDDQAT